MELNNFNNVQSMTSLEIAERTGKKHFNVLRDIDKLINDLGTDISFEVSAYVDPTGRSLKLYKLDKEATLLLVSGYRNDLRLNIIRRWKELELGNNNLRQRFADLSEIINKLKQTGSDWGRPELPNVKLK